MVEQVAPTEMSAEVARVAPLLMLLSREHLETSEVARARAMAEGLSRPGEAGTPGGGAGGDWETLLRIAADKRGLPFVAHHVAALDLLPADSPDRARLKQASMHMAMQWLRFAAAQKAFLDTCLAPAGIPHLFFKGATLARYYTQPALRISRDIDVLVAPDRAADAIAAAQAAGYRVVLNHERGQWAESARDIAALLRYKRDIALVSPEGIQIEMHTRLWYWKELREIGHLLETAETADLQGTAYRVLPTTPLFVYLAHHHNRHLWSSLNWLADIAALRRAPDFDRDAVCTLARSMGLEDVVTATLAFDDLVRGAPASEGEAAQARARECRHFCGLTLTADPPTERAIYYTQVDPETDWRVPEALRQTESGRRWRARFTPTIYQYLDQRLPLWLHWLYPVQRAVRAGRDRVESVLKGQH